MSLLKTIRLQRRESERKLCRQTGMARATLRSVEQENNNVTLESLRLAAQAVERRVEILTVPLEPCRSEVSSVAISCKMVRDGFDAWPYYLMEMVDGYRKHWDQRLVLLPPLTGLDPRLMALMASTVCALSDEAQTAAPEWALQIYFLPSPWFPSEMESLKASAILESPLPFRRNNIFVLENFLRRA